MSLSPRLSSAQQFGLFCKMEELRGLTLEVDAISRDEGGSLIPNIPQTLEQYMERETMSGAFKAICQYFGSMAGETVDLAVTLETYDMLTTHNVKNLVGILTRMTCYPDAIPTSIAIMDDLLHRALTGTLLECRAVVKIILPLLSERGFCKDDCHQYFFAIIRQCLLNQIPTEGEYEDGLKGKPGCAKVYYASKVLSGIEVLVRKVRRASFIAGILYMTNAGDGQKAITSIIHDLIPKMFAAIITFQGFDTLCEIIITVREEKFGHWGGKVLDFPSKVKTELKMNMRSYLQSLRSRFSRSDKGVTWEILDYVTKRFAQVFRHKDDDEAIGPVYPRTSQESAEADAQLLETFYPKLWKVSKRNIQKSPSLLQKKGIPTWQDMIEDISTLLYYGAARSDLLPHLLQGA